MDLRSYLREFRLMPLYERHRRIIKVKKTPPTTQVPNSPCPSTPAAPNDPPPSGLPLDPPSGQDKGKTYR